MGSIHFIGHQVEVPLMATAQKPWVIRVSDYCIPISLELEREIVYQFVVNNSLDILRDTVKQHIDISFDIHKLDIAPSFAVIHPIMPLLLEHQYVIPVTKIKYQNQWIGVTKLQTHCLNNKSDYIPSDTDLSAVYKKAFSAFYGHKTFCSAASANPDAVKEFLYLLKHSYNKQLNNGEKINTWLRANGLPEMGDYQRRKTLQRLSFIMTLCACLFLGIIIYNKITNQQYAYAIIIFCVSIISITLWLLVAIKYIAKPSSTNSVFK